MKHSSRFWFSVLAPLVVAVSMGVVGGVTYLLAMVLNGDYSPLWLIPISLAVWAMSSALIYSNNY